VLLSYQANVHKKEEKLIYCQHCGMPAFADVAFDDSSHTAFINGTELQFSPTQWAIFYKLYTRFGRIVPHDELLDELLESTERKAIHVHICLIRRAFRKISEPWFIESVEGIGYRLITGKGPVINVNKQKL
jgi:DNA-binding response OmpR family regulator